MKTALALPRPFEIMLNSGRTAIDLMNVFLCIALSFMIVVSLSIYKRNYDRDIIFIGDVLTEF
jgi:hypothetical protein